MSLGDYPAGEGPAGFDPIATSTRNVTPAPKALLYDMAARQTLLDADGYARSMDPIDQEVRLSLGIELGSLPSSPTTGLDLGRLRRARPDTVQNIAVDAVNVALAGPLSRKDIVVTSVQASNVDGRVLLVVDYRNARTAKLMRAETA